MSRKFRWFLLASCAFVVLMGGREAIALLADGPQMRRQAPERRSSLRIGEDRVQPSPGRRGPLHSIEGELARGEARKP